MMEILQRGLTTRTLLSGGLRGLGALALSQITSDKGLLALSGDATAANQSTISGITQLPWAIERDVGDAIIAGNYQWGHHGDARPLVSALKKLRTHFGPEDAHKLEPVVAAIGKEWQIDFGVEAIRPLVRQVSCPEADFISFAKQMLEKTEILQQKRHQKEKKRIDQHPLQYVVCDAVHMTLGVESHEAGDLLQILGRRMEHSFSPNRPNSPNHRIGFSGVVTRIHCVLSNKIFSLDSKKGT